ncbi:hypothetical protein GCM10023320_71350 [Pseudonocardia adelaidensis]|uniref:Uncharacterized protein n=2 Tax=Pseudonocardia adelaidensis TaxID=648754 RepID=A0ABP9P2M3_9PSEU
MNDRRIDGIEWLCPPHSTSAAAPDRALHLHGRRQERRMRSSTPGNSAPSDLADVAERLMGELWFPEPPGTEVPGTTTIEWLDLDLTSDRAVR